MFFGNVEIKISNPLLYFLCLCCNLYCILYFTIPRSRPRYQKSQTTPKPQSCSTTQPSGSEASEVQDTTTPSENLHPASVENLKPSPPDTLNGIINAHNSEARSEENWNLNAANVYVNIPELVHITKLSIKSDNDGANVEKRPEKLMTYHQQAFLNNLQLLSNHFHLKME